MYLKQHTAQCWLELGLGRHGRTHNVSCQKLDQSLSCLRTAPRPPSVTKAQLHSGPSKYATDPAFTPATCRLYSPFAAFLPWLLLAPWKQWSGLRRSNIDNPVVLTNFSRSERTTKSHADRSICICLRFLSHNCCPVQMVPCCHSTQAGPNVSAHRRRPSCGSTLNIVRGRNT